MEEIVSRLRSYNKDKDNFDDILLLFETLDNNVVERSSDLLFNKINFYRENKNKLKDTLNSLQINFDEKRYEEVYYNMFSQFLNMNNNNHIQKAEIIEKDNDNCKKYFSMYSKYNSERILKRSKISKSPNIVFVITSCKRLDLFKQTMNSFLNCCLDSDMINDWYCIDDNSSEYDRSVMKEMYPFFNFILKDETNKGHVKSMNMIRDISKNYDYVFHCEDDWLFISRRKYITDCLDVLLNGEDNCKQCLLNYNYSETHSNLRYMVGGILKYTKSTSLQYIIHDHYPSNNMLEFTKKYGEIGVNCAYWPHYSFRPSLIKTTIFQELGEFTNSRNFEMEYAYRYMNKGYVSCMLNGLFCIHIGRLTNERDDKTKLNAYELNGMVQYDDLNTTKKENNNLVNDVNPIIINLRKRKDRMLKIMREMKKHNIKTYKRYDAIDGDLYNGYEQEHIQKLFDFNDYSMRAGMVGCALSHLDIWTKFFVNESSFVQKFNLKSSEYMLVMEDDLKLRDNFNVSLNNIIEYFSNKQKEWDIIFIGHHIRENNIIKDVTYGNSVIEKSDDEFIKCDSKEAMNYSYGGTGAYLISKIGCGKIINFIMNRTFTNCVDTMMQLSGDDLNLYYTKKHLIFTDCFTKNRNVDSDIQRNFKSLELTPNQRLENLIKNNPKIIFKKQEQQTNDVDENTVLVFKKNNFDIKKCNTNYYSIRDEFFLVFTNKKLFDGKLTFWIK